MKKLFGLITSVIIMQAGVQSVLAQDSINSPSMGIASVPTTYNWAPGTELPAGWAATGMGTYTTGNIEPNSGKFDGSGDSLVIHVDAMVGQLSYYIKGNSLKVPYQFSVMESEDGVNYEMLMSHTETASSIDSKYTQFIAMPNSTSRFIKFYYELKTSGNVAIDDVELMNDATTGLSKTVDKEKVSNINNTLYIKDAADVQSVAIYNILGKLIISKSNLSGEPLHISTATLTPGVYFLNLYKNTGEQRTVKFVQQ